MKRHDHDLDSDYSEDEHEFKYDCNGKGEYKKRANILNYEIWFICNTAVVYLYLISIFLLWMHLKKNSSLSTFKMLILRILNNIISLFKKIYLEMKFQFYLSALRDSYWCRIMIKLKLPLKPCREKSNQNIVS